MSGRNDVPPFFAVAAQRHDAVATVVATGEIDLATAPRLSAALRAATVDADLLVLDLAAVTFIDSTGIRTLLEADGHAADSGCRLVLLVCEGPVKRVLALCGLDRRLAVVATDAIAPRAPERHPCLVPATVAFDGSPNGHGAG
jgi:anti-anti-sigma factor